LKKGGIFLLEHYTRENIGRGVGGPQHESLFFTKEEAHNYFHDGYDVTISTIERNMHEGELHHGLSAVIQIIVKK
jgi:hypothetical protein